MTASAKSNASIKALCVAALALIASLSVAARNFSHPYAVYDGVYSDHFSHMCSTVMFMAKGLDIYRKPVNRNLVRSTQPKDIEFAHANELGTRELFVNPLNPARPPLAINWSSEIRAYPPGVYLLFLPVALPFQLQKLSFAAANRAIILFLVAVAALSTFLLFKEAFLAEDRWGRWMRISSAALVCYWIQCWALRGFYDVVSLLLVFACLWELDRKRWLNSIFFYCVAVFLHYRALYYAPVPAVALWMAWRQARSEGKNLLDSWVREPRFWIAAVFAIVSGVCFWIALPQLQGFSRNNPLYHFAQYRASLDWTSFVALGLIGLTLLFFRNWTAVLILACYAVFLIRTPQTYPWHSLFLAPLLVYCSLRSRRWLDRLSWASVFVLTCWLGHFVYGIR